MLFFYNLWQCLLIDLGLKKNHQSAGFLAGKSTTKERLALP
jgi:hypothetical protein